MVPSRSLRTSCCLKVGPVGPVGHLHVVVAHVAHVGHVERRIFRQSFVGNHVASKRHAWGDNFMSKRRTCSNSGVAYFLHVTVSLCLQVFFFFSPLISWCLYAILSATLYNTPECCVEWTAQSCAIGTALCLSMPWNYGHVMSCFFAGAMARCKGHRISSFPVSVHTKDRPAATVFPGQRKPAEVQKGAGKTLRSHVAMTCHSSAMPLRAFFSWPPIGIWNDLLLMTHWWHTAYCGILRHTAAYCATKKWGNADRRRLHIRLKDDQSLLHQAPLRQAKQQSSKANHTCQRVETCCNVLPKFV